MLQKAEDAPISFGDVFEAPWLFDAYLREGAEYLARIPQRDGHLYKPRPVEPTDREGGKDYALTFASAEDEFPVNPAGDGGEATVSAFGHQRRAIVLSDDCEADKVMERGGRLLLATLSPWPDESNKDGRTQAKNLRERTGSWRAFGLPPDEPMAWTGAVVDFSKTVTVHYKALPKAKRVASLTADEAGDLEAQWCAYGTRHGPLVALDAARKLVAMSAITDPELWKVPYWDVPIDTDRETAAARIAEALELAWSIEGVHFNTVSDGYSAKEDAGAHISATVAQLQQLREATDEALEALKKLS